MFCVNDLFISFTLLINYIYAFHYQMRKNRYLKYFPKLLNAQI